MMNDSNRIQTVLDGASEVAETYRRLLVELDVDACDIELQVAELHAAILRMLVLSPTQASMWKGFLG